MVLFGCIENHTGKDWKLVEYHASAGFISSVSNAVSRNWQSYFNAQASAYNGNLISSVLFKVGENKDDPHDVNRILIRYKLISNGSKNFSVRYNLI